MKGTAAEDGGLLEPFGELVAAEACLVALQQCGPRPGLTDPDPAVPFGRTKADMARKEAVAGAQRAQVGRYLHHLLSAGDRLRALLSSMDEAEWSARGLHPTLGEMDVDAILERFLIGHLEEHAAQLESLHGS